jgi:hypothetical protein
MLLQLHTNLYFWVIFGSPFARSKLWLCATHVVKKHCYNKCILFCWKVSFTSVWPQLMLHYFYRLLQLKIYSKCEANLLCYKRNKKWFNDLVEGCKQSFVLLLLHVHVSLSCNFCCVHATNLNTRSWNMELKRHNESRESISWKFWKLYSIFSSISFLL